MKVIVQKAKIQKGVKPDLLLSEVCRQAEYFYEVVLGSHCTFYLYRGELLKDAEVDYEQGMRDPKRTILIHESKTGACYALSMDLFLNHPSDYWGILDAEDIFISQTYPEEALGMGVYLKSNSHVRWIMDLRGCILTDHLHMFDHMDPQRFPDLIVSSSCDNLFLLPEYLMDRVELIPKDLSGAEMQELVSDFWYKFFIVKKLLRQKPWQLS